MPPASAIRFTWVLRRGLTGVWPGLRMSNRKAPPPGYSWNCRARLSRARGGEKGVGWGRSPAVRLDLALGPFQFLDHLLTGIEDICGHYGHHHWKDK